MPNPILRRRAILPPAINWLHNGTWTIVNGVPAMNRPVLGSELLSNPSFDSNTTGWTGSTATLASVAGGQSSNALQVTNSGSNGYAYASGATAAGDWIVFSYYFKNSTATSATVRLASTSSGTDVAVRSGENDAAFTPHSISGQAVGASTFARLINIGASGVISLFDEVSMKVAAQNTLFAFRRGIVNPSSIIATGTVVSGGQCGVAYGWDSYTNPQTGLLALVDGANAKLLKCVAGAWTQLISTAATSVAGVLPQIKWTGGTTYQLFYNGVQRGADQSVADAGTGIYHGVFSTTPLNGITGFSIN